MLTALTMARVSIVARINCQKRWVLVTGWMIQRELRLTLPKDSAIKIGRTLRASKVNDWSMYWQDMAFWLVWNHGDGRSHWAQTSYKVRSCS